MQVVLASKGESVKNAKAVRIAVAIILGIAILAAAGYAVGPSVVRTLHAFNEVCNGVNISASSACDVGSPLPILPIAVVGGLLLVMMGVLKASLWVFPPQKPEDESQP